MVRQSRIHPEATIVRVLRGNWAKSSMPMDVSMVFACLELFRWFLLGQRRPGNHRKRTANAVSATVFGQCFSGRSRLTATASQETMSLRIRLCIGEPKG